MRAALTLAALLFATTAHAGGIMLPGTSPGGGGSSTTYKGPTKAQPICTSSYTLTGVNFQCTFSGSPAQNDILWAACPNEDGSGGVPAANTGWTLDHSSTNGQVAVAYVWRVPGASEPATETPCTLSSGQHPAVAIVDLTGFSSTTFSAHFTRGSTATGFNGPVTTTVSLAASYLIVAFSSCASNSTVNTVLTLSGLNGADFTASAGNTLGGTAGVGAATGTMVGSGGNLTTTYGNTCDEQLDVNYFN